MDPSSRVMARRARALGAACRAALAVTSLACTADALEERQQAPQDSAEPPATCDHLVVAPPQWVASDGHLEALGDASQPVPLVRGIQGGWHVELMSALDTPDDTVSVVANAQLDGLPFGGDDAPHDRYVAAYDGCHGTLWTRVFIDPTALEPDTICAADGRRITVHVEIGDPPGYRLDVEGRATIDGFGIEYCQGLLN